MTLHIINYGLLEEFIVASDWIFLIILKLILQKPFGQNK